ncbi:uncharacterized protein LOC132204145 [Neocloeon triangulifer]|uniref:uncharacterized protein LOC132204145 n=1 Tax=Neocloeon triangulifer TaxID=2078957 RepID=UPI00286F2E5B|nr:uncharacterized protein LOC132204145 [Neocloeon triangulifer]XP_059488433.1 uncharacterized protein LOC132204145 [Neocloeon triangulifer]
MDSSVPKRRVVPVTVPFDELDAILFENYSGRQQIARVRKNSKLSEEMNVTDSLPNVETIVISHSNLKDNELGLEPKPKRLKRNFTFAGYKDEFDNDQKYSASKYQLFYRALEQKRETFEFHSYLKRYLNDEIQPVKSAAELALKELPRCSILSAGKQKMYLRLKAKYKGLNSRDAEKDAIFQTLCRVVHSEQRDYLSFCQNQAKYSRPIDYERVLPGLINYIERSLFHRQQSTPLEYEAFYHLHSVIDMNKLTLKNFGFKPSRMLMALGQVPFTDTVCKFYKGLSLERMAEEMEFLVPSDNSLGYKARKQDGPCIYKTPISCDPNALYFGAETEAKIVTCSSVMELLVDIHPYSLQNSATRRDIPVIVKMLDLPDGSQKKVVFLDKALPPLEMTTYDKKVWACKRAVRELFAASDIKAYNFSNLDEIELNKEKDKGDEEEEASDDEEIQNAQEEDFPLMPPPNANIVYGLYSIEERGHSVRPINLVVRSSYHAYEIKSGSDEKNYLHFSVKLEEQPEYGAQCTTISEVSREWMALSLRKGSMLCRVRVDAKTLQVIQVQKMRMKALKQECKSRGMHINFRAATLHHVFSELTELEPGSYILQLIPIEGVARLLEHDTTDTNLRGGSFYNLHLHFHKSNHLIGPTSHIPYSLIDPLVATPYHVEHNRVPATFEPKIGFPSNPINPHIGNPEQLVATTEPTEEGNEDGLDLDFHISDNESLEEWMAENETRNCAKLLEEALGDTLKEALDQVETEEQVEKQPDSPEKLVTNEEDADIMRIIMEMRVNSPISHLGSYMGSSVAGQAAAASHLTFN